jgi:hypothetical protein
LARSLLGVGEELLGRGLLDDLTVAMKTTRVGGLAGEAHLVGHNDHRHALLGEGDHRVEDLVDHFGVERRGRFVEQHPPSASSQSPGDRHALLLAAGELGRQLSAWLSTPTRLSSDMASSLASPPSSP